MNSLAGYKSIHESLVGYGFMNNLAILYISI